MAERGARPKVPAWRLKALRALRAFFTPLMPDDYLELINPLWSTQELRGRIERIERETADAVTVLIKPGWEWEGHRPGQYLRVGFEVNGKHHWRAYSITSDPGPARRVHQHHAQAAGDRRGLTVRGPRGQAGHDRAPRRRGGDVRAARRASRAAAVRQRRERDHADHEHAAQPRPRRRPPRRRAPALGPHRGRHHLRRASCGALDERHDGYRLEKRLTHEQGRLAPSDLDVLCPDWREREAFACGPAGLLDALAEHWEQAGGDAGGCTWSASSRSSARAKASTATAERSAF